MVLKPAGTGCNFSTTIAPLNGTEKGLHLKQVFPNAHPVCHWSSKEIVPVQAHTIGWLILKQSNVIEPQSAFHEELNCKWRT